MGLIRFFRAQWTDAEKSGKWMADAYPSLSDRGRRVIERQPRWGVLDALAFLAIPVVFVTLLVVGLVVFLVAWLIDALT